MNKKGFTLIELLAVILILGIIALIAIPAVTDVISDAKKGAEETTINHIIKAYEDYAQIHTLQNKYIYTNVLATSNDEDHPTLADTQAIAAEIGISGDIHAKSDYVTFELDGNNNAYVKYHVGNFYCANFVESGDPATKTRWSKGVCKVCSTNNCTYPSSVSDNN